MSPVERVVGRLSIGLLGRLLVILLLTVGIEFAASTWLYERSSRALIQDDEAHRLAEHLVIARTLVSGQPLPERPAMAERVTTDRYDIHWSGSTAAPPDSDGKLAAMRAKVIRWEPALAASDLRIALRTVGREPQIFGGLRLTDGSWLRFRAAAPSGDSDLALHRVVLALLPAGVLLLIGALMFRHTLRPMAALARAAEEVGRGGRQTVADAGPIEVRHVIHAFNVMQARIHRLIAERTQALAAVGHDLRTPLARLRLRSEEVADEGLRRLIDADVTEMDDMVASLLAYLGGETDPERQVRTDLAVLIATQVDTATDLGHEAHYDGPTHLEAEIRPVSLRRAIGNLIENAIQYGGEAAVSLSVETDTLVIRVEDRGPGIPEDRIEMVTQPFARLDHARSRNTRGLGLGLAIVAKAVSLSGGTLTLANRAEGGLRATISLPR